MTPTRDTTTQPEGLGELLRGARQAMRLSLREVEARTQKAVSNGYLSQIEQNIATRPAPNVLYSLATLYGLDYSDLMRRAGHHIPDASARSKDTDDLAGLPLRALAELNDAERKELTDYVAWMRERRRRQAGSAT